MAIDRLRAEAKASTLEKFRERYGEYFLVVHIHDVATSAADTAKAKTKTGVSGTSTTTPPPANAPTAVFPMKKKAKSTLDWIAVGRNEANDVFLPHASISRIHAFFRDMGSTMMLQDGRSSNGTFVAGPGGELAVPPHGEGQPMPMTPGSTVRFGDVVATFLNAEGLFAILTKLG